MQETGSLNLEKGHLANINICFEKQIKTTQSFVVRCTIEQIFYYDVNL